jgi:hypothetical protein
MPMPSSASAASSCIATKAAVAIEWMIIGIAHRASFQDTPTPQNIFKMTTPFSFHNGWSNCVPYFSPLRVR